MAEIPEPIFAPDGDDVLELITAMQTVMREMEEGNIQASVAHRALCRKAYEPFRALLDDDGMDYMSFGDALHIRREADMQIIMEERWQWHLAGNSLGYKSSARTLEDGTAEICMGDFRYQKAPDSFVWAAVLPQRKATGDGL
ncbi:hypothetical protein [Lichenicoccus roseus]|uniref:Uncharacterized protein n=1 Tax=Lichenicoccus roseus TaxID=2683649 RepID=A0A5R9J354_9PROT|nr:hypothetical protein [Lichenicoccus roseus]TLU71273.1 hypothetical protein FE263_17370 [Lichenicoccus roseus]